MVVKRFGVMSVAKVYGALTAAMGLLFGLFVAAASALGMGLSEGDEPAIIAAMLGVGAVIFLPDLLRSPGRRHGRAFRRAVQPLCGDGRGHQDRGGIALTEVTEGTEGEHKRRNGETEVFSGNEADGSRPDGGRTESPDESP